MLSFRGLVTKSMVALVATSYVSAARVNTVPGAYIVEFATPEFSVQATDKVS